MAKRKKKLTYKEAMDAAVEGNPLLRALVAGHSMDEAFRIAMADPQTDKRPVAAIYDDKCQAKPQPKRS